MGTQMRGLSGGGAGLHWSYMESHSTCCAVSLREAGARM